MLVYFLLQWMQKLFFVSFVMDSTRTEQTWWFFKEPTALLILRTVFFFCHTANVTVGLF